MIIAHVISCFVEKLLNVPDLSCTHLGHTLTANLSDGDDIFRCSLDFIRQANGILVKFGSCDPFVLTNPLTCFCMSYYRCALWSLDSCATKNLDVCINNCLRRIWFFTKELSH